MRPDLEFLDTVKFYETTKTDYGTDKLTDAECLGTIGGKLVASIGYQHGNNQDAINADATLFLPYDDEFITDNYYRLEGMPISISLYGAPDAVQFFKITSCTPARDILLGNEVVHVECLLSKLAGVIDAS